MCDVVLFGVRKYEVRGATVVLCTATVGVVHQNGFCAAVLDYLMVLTGRVKCSRDVAQKSESAEFFKLCICICI